MVVDWIRDKYSYNLVIDTIVPRYKHSDGIFRVETTSVVISNFLKSLGYDGITPDGARKSFLIEGDIQFLFDFLKVLGIEKKYVWRTTVYVKD
jgi:hypothetical protein